MSPKVLSAAVIGLDCEVVEVEADITHSFEKHFTIVGLPDAAIKESKERVRAAIKNSKLMFPRCAPVVNLAPADLHKQGPAYDLPIAISVLVSDNNLNLSDQEQREAIFIGELSLGGELRPVNGALSVALMARARGFKRIYCPAGNAPEASLVGGLEIIPVADLASVVKHLDPRSPEIIKPFVRDKDWAQELAQPVIAGCDFAFIKGQETVKRAMEIAAAGGHNMLMSGPPGAGKTLLARTMPTILPSLTLAEALETTKIYSVAGRLPNNQPLIKVRPFRAPHHTASGVALVGGGTFPKPGEISLAHRGVLFLDEFPEFPRQVLENLRQPLEDGVITVSRAAGSIEFPAKFILVAAMNPCPCGYSTDPLKQCTCTPFQIIQYQKKISGPLLDRIDLHIEVPRVEFEKLANDQLAEKSAVIRQRVQVARARQAERFKELPIFTNSEIIPAQIKNFCQVDEPTQELLRNAVHQLHLSARSYHRILKLALTIADLAGSDRILIQHVAEALQYRPKVE